MICHIVMWKLKGTAEEKQKNAQEIRRRLYALPPIIPQIRSMEVGINVNPGEMAYDAVLVSEFDTVETLKEYREHPAHKEVSAFVKTIRESRVVVDYEKE